MKPADILNGWSQLEPKTKWMAIGTIAIMGLSVFLSVSGLLSAPSVDEIRQQSQQANVIVEEGVEIPEDADPIPVASEETRLVTSLVEVLSNKECIWSSPDDEILWVGFTAEGFTEHRGDLTNAATVEFYSIEVIENGRQGTWRVTYEDGTIHDAAFTFAQNPEVGTYTFTSAAFRQSTTYTTSAISSEDVLEW